MWFKLPEKSLSHSKPFELGFPLGKPQFRFTCKPELNYNVANVKHSGCFDLGSSLDSNEKFELSKTDLLKSIRPPSSSFFIPLPSIIMWIWQSRRISMDRFNSGNFQSVEEAIENSDSESFKNDIKL